MTGDELRAVIDEPALRSDVSAVELASVFLDRIEAEQPRLRAFITVTPELGLADARRVDEARARGERLPLDGLPIAIKDNIDVAGVRCTVGSRLFGDRVAAEDSEVARRLREAGGVCLGKTNLHELAFGATSANEAFGPVVNPWGAIVPGGSSGGSGAAVAADLCIAAVGTDTGGSIRLPASLCGIAGIRPTSGAVSNDGVYPVSSTLDTVGPMARSVVHLSELLDAMAEDAMKDPGFDGLRGVRVGRLRGFFLDGVHPDVRVLVLDAFDALAELGAEPVDLELEGAAEAVEACGHLIRVEALSVHRRHLSEHPELIEEGTRTRLALAEGLSAVDFALVLRRMAEWERAVGDAFESVDVLVTPTIGVYPPAASGADSVSTTAAVVPFTHAFSFARVPALSLPCGLTSAGHPVGVQLAAAPWRDRLLLRVGAAYQGATDWHRRRPPEP
jgi:aspartyl-tRNA(Asn)/glutamyl-tRNA(Gln) amidotransferase subunit A